VTGAAGDREPDQALAALLAACLGELALVPREVALTDGDRGRDQSAHEQHHQRGHPCASEPSGPAMLAEVFNR
jgi:hypothetical protein